MLRTISLVALAALVAASVGCSVSTDGIFGGGGSSSQASTGAGTRGGAGGANTGSGGGATGQGVSVSVGVAAGGGSQGGGGQGGGSNSSGSGHGGQGGHGPDCDTLLQNVNSALAAAQACKQPFLNQPTPCQSVEMGVCCPVLVAFGDSTETNDYLQALAVYENAGCHAPCPGGMCNQAPTGKCNAPIGGSGTCVAGG